MRRLVLIDRGHREVRSWSRQFEYESVLLSWDLPAAKVMRSATL